VPVGLVADHVRQLAPAWDWRDCRRADILESLRTPDRHVGPTVSEFESACVVPFALDRVAAFFADPANLEKLTPGWLRLRLVEAPDEVRVGSLLRYRAAPFGLAQIWVAEISVWEPPYRFADVQRSGPYRAWEHTHAFAAVESGTEIRDRIRYRLPGGPFAPVADRCGHRALLSRLFSYRTRMLTELLGAGR